MKLVNKTGYLKGAKTAKNSVNIIPSSLITTEGMAFPIKANGKTLYPNTGQYKFPTSHVVETPLKQDGADELVPNKMSKTTLSKAQEIAYQKWMKSKEYNESDDYDMKGYWKKEGFKNLGSPKGGEHFTDEFKRLAPFSEGDNYPTLSDESNRASKFDKRGQGTWVGEGDNAKYINYQKGALSISANNKKQFADVANMKSKVPKKEGTLRQKMKKSFSTLNKPITFGQKPGSIGDKIGSILNLGSSRPGQGYSITPTTTAKETALNYATGEAFGLAVKPVVKYVTPYLKQAGKYLKDKISPTKVIPKQTNASKSNFNLKNLFGSKDSKIQSGTDWMKDWYSDSDFARRYSSTGQHPAIKMQLEILNRLNQYQPKNYKDLYKDKGLKKYLNNSFTTEGLSYGTPKGIYLNRTMSPFNKKGLESTRTHELTHLIERNGITFSKADEEALLKSFKIPKKKAGFFQRNFLNNNPEYYLDPSEIHARMNEARYSLGLSPKDKFTEEMFDKVSKKNNWGGMGRYIKDKKGFTDLMNNFWAAPPVAIGAGAMQEKKNGVKTLKYKEGSKGVSLAFSRGEKDPKGGLTQKGVDKYNRATGGNLKMAVTTPPSKLKAGSKAANRRKSFCARMSGVKGPMTKPNGKPSRKALALRKWNC